MSECVIAWARDLHSKSPHDRVPITCGEYIKILEGGYDLDKLNAAREVLGLPPHGED